VQRVAWGGLPIEQIPADQGRRWRYEHIIVDIVFGRTAEVLSAFLASDRKKPDRQSRRDAGSVTKVVTIENLLGDQLTITP
jgi:hypothetical protein